ncbi:SNF2-related protein [Streptomyces sp. NPDC048442]|uniref:DEAD/DEAH box helicase n=1 Tax=Streptomyces sp. NPDC048442 TaxID=3154823 RepID=UPI003436E270
MSSKAGTPCTDCTAASATSAQPNTRPHSQPDHHTNGVRQSGTSSGTGTPASLDSGQLGIGELLDRRWQFTLDGAPLTENELATLADAAMPCVRLRNRWILLDDVLRERLKTRRLPPQGRLQALLDVLYGHITLDGRTIACRPADGLALLIENLHNPTPVPLPAGIPDLYPYQATAVQRLHRLTELGFGALLADEMGTGKTVTALAFHLLRSQSKHAPTLVICPTTVIDHWCDEAAQHIPDTPVIRYQGPHRSLTALRPHSIVITSYEVLRRDHRQLTEISWGLVVADEAQRVKNSRIHLSRLIRSLTGARLALTGTPMENSPTDLWAILDWCNPELFGSRTQFNAPYTRPLAHTTPEATQDTEDRLKALLKPFMIRRLKEDPALNLRLPAKHIKHHPVPLSPEQIGLYEALTRDTLEQVRACANSPRRGQLVLNLINSLKKICISPAHYLDEDTESVAADPAEAARRAPKFATLYNLLHTTRERGGPPSSSPPMYTPVNSSTAT